MTDNFSSKLKSFLPIWLPIYKREWLRADIIAGLTSGAVVVPVSLAYTTIAGLPVQMGLYTALAALVLYALFGTSMVLSVSVTSMLSVLTASAVSPYIVPSDPEAFAQAASELALLTGVILLIAGVLRLGFLANFISQPVLIGLKLGLGMWIASSQLGKLLGIPFENQTFFENIGQALRQLNAISFPTLLLSIITILVILAVNRWVPRLPSALIAVLVGIGLQLVLNISQYGIALVDPIPVGLPAIRIPSFEHFGVFLPAALGIALMSGIESITTGRSFARRNDPRINANREWFALGAANLGAALLGGYATGGGASQTAVNIRAGARSQVSGLVTAALVILALTLLAPLFNRMPLATLGSIVLFAAFGLINFSELQLIFKVRQRDAILALIAFAGVLLAGPLASILIAVALSIIVLFYQTTKPSVYVLGRKPGTDVYRPLELHKSDESIEGMLIVRPVGGLYFANSDHVIDHVKELVAQTLPKPKVLLIDASAIPDIEYSSALALKALRRDLLADGTDVWYTGYNPVPFEMVKKGLGEEELKSGRFFNVVEDAVAAYQAQTSAEKPTAPVD